MRVRRTLTGILAVPLLLLSACGGGDSTAEPPVSSAPTRDHSSTPPQRESPEHFIRRFAALERKMENSGEVGQYRAVSRPCSACQELAQQIKSFYEAGGFVKWGGWDIKSVRPYAPGETGAYAVRVVSAPTRYQESSDGNIKHLDGGPATEIVTIHSKDGSWVVVGRARLES
jgi:hypothetical protein